MKTRNTLRSVLRATVLCSSLGLALTSSPVRSIAQAGIQQSETASPEQFVGYYQMPTNADFIRIEHKDGILWATKLWDDQKYQLEQIDETHFKSQAEAYQVEFLKDNAGQVVAVKILDKFTAIKVAFNPEVVLQLSDEQLQPFAGTYSLTGKENFQIDIRPSASGLILKQLWDNKEISFSARSDNFFLSEDGSFPMTFRLSGGKVTQVTCFEKDSWLKIQ